MAATSTRDILEVIKPVYGWKSELKAFDDSKAGVKGIVDAGIVRIPQIFVSNPSDRHENTCSDKSKIITIPIIDFEGIDEDTNLRNEVVEKVRVACEGLGFFQLLNHGIPVSVMEEVLDGIRRFHEQDTEVKRIDARKKNVWVDVEMKRDRVYLWRPTSDMTTIAEALGSTVAWPADKVIFASSLE